MRVAAAVGKQAMQFLFLVGGPIPDEIVTALAGLKLVIGAGDRVAEHLLALRQAKREILEEIRVRARADFALRHEAAPGDVAGVERLRLGQILRPHRRANAIGADKEIAFGAIPIGKIRGDALAALLATDEFLTEMVARRRKRIAQQAEHAVPRGDDLRERLLRAQLALAVEYPADFDVDAKIVVGVDRRQAQGIAQFRVGNDAGAAAGKLRAGALENFRLPAGAAQQQPREQAADRPATDEDAGALCQSA